MTEKPLRMFFAVPVAIPQSLQRISTQLGAMGRALKVVEDSGVHITLKFLGETTAEQAELLCEEAIKIAQRHPPFELELCGLGAFPHWKRPSVIWAGVADAGPIVDLASELETAAELLGFPKESRGYHPHLTLARVKAKPPPELFDLADAHAGTSFGRQTIDRVVLYQSELTPAGPVYTPYHTPLLVHA